MNFSTRWRPVLLMVQFHHLCEMEEDLYNASFMSASRQTDIPALTACEQQAVFTYTKFLARHQLEFPFRSLIEELSLPNPDDLGRCSPDRDGCIMTVPKDQTVLEASDMHRPHWHREQDLGSRLLPRAFTNRSQPYVVRMDCKPNLPNPPVHS